MKTRKYLVLNSTQEKELNTRERTYLASVKCDYTDIITPSMR